MAKRNNKLAKPEPLHSLSEAKVTNFASQAPQLKEPTSLTEKKSKNRTGSIKTGFAWTVRYPQGGHPAHFNRTGQDSVEYVTFTTSPNDVVLFNGKIARTLELHHNIDTKKKGNQKEKSHILEAVFEGKRSALGKGTDQFRIAPEDRHIVESVYNAAPRYKVPTKPEKK